MSDCQTRMFNVEFTDQEIREASDRGRLLSMEIEFSTKCNFKCPYCYAVDDSFIDKELDKKQIENVILQAKNMGARKIIILGGEPLVYSHILEVLAFIRDQGLEVEMFTNGSMINEVVANALFDLGINVVLKMNSFTKDTQDMLTGVQGSHIMIREAINNILKAGYPSQKKYVAVSTIICRQNIHELVDLWIWLRERNIIPYFEMITPQGEFNNHKWLEVDSLELEKLFKEIAKVDKENYGNDWNIQPPLVGNKCFRHHYSCFVNVKGDVLPCVGVTIPMGNIKNRSLKNILETSEVIEDLKAYKKLIKGPCRECEQLDNCYGCRGAAYQLTGDYLASDPLCWKNYDKKEQILKLPISVDDIIPQKAPMKVIDQLVAVYDRRAEASVCVSKDMLFVEKSGELNSAVYLEMMAQTIAAYNCFKKMGDPDYKMEGFLIGAKKLEILGKASIGDNLMITIEKKARLGNFAIIDGKVINRDKLLARGEVKVWHSESPKEGRLTLVQ
ncbi:MAG: radical SAM protein [Candidatus Omnitrophica bacterium]|nr:radical SAM protein [Candidatus Omnitrophota bacterium]